MITIRAATHAHLDDLVPLVDGYRRFYHQPGDVDGARRFMSERLVKGDAHVLLALDDDDHAIGFAQLFPVPSTTSLASRWILNDLFVIPEARRQAPGAPCWKRLANAHAHGVSQLMLRTQVDNETAKARYHALGWQRDAVFDTYLLTI